MLTIYLGARQAPFWKGMGLSWVPLERHLAGFGALLGVSWRFWGASWTLLGRSWSSLGWSGDCHGCIFALRGALGLDFNTAWDVSDWFWEGFV